jgi:protein TonB
MFELITGEAKHIPSKPALPVFISISAQLVFVGALIVPVLFLTDQLPVTPTMLAFVAAPPATPPPPPPPPPPAATQAKSPESRPVPTTGAAPIEAPAEIAPERLDDEGEEGVPGGVQGGIPGGVVGGVVGGLPTEKQWRYSPLVLNGIRESFVLTVVLSFQLRDAT